jgi:2-keto-4-pentenoate hydratase/2-oxohepta-3-ene-1,7-dioic acid hydratase in catechol pathway
VRSFTWIKELDKPNSTGGEEIMKLLTIRTEGNNYSLGVKTGRGIVDIALAGKERTVTGVSVDIMELIRQGESGLQALQSFLADLEIDGKEGNPQWLLDEAQVKWGPAVPHPSKIVCVGLNYRKHAEETDLPYPPEPLLFNKFPNSLTACGQNIPIPATAQQMDYEVELCVVIGKQAKNVSVDVALEHVWGYCTANDVSARDWQTRTSQWMLGKTSDGFCPVGPYLVTADEVLDPQNLTLKTYVNGEQRQNSNTSDMIFTCAQIISYISHHFTLEPGDLVLTGTPEGVAMGLPPDSRVYLQPGDEVNVEVGGLGCLTNRFVAAS